MSKLESLKFHFPVLPALTGNMRSGYKLGPSLAPDRLCGADHPTHIAWLWSKARADPFGWQEEEAGTGYSAGWGQKACVHERLETHVHSHTTTLSRAAALVGPRMSF